MRSAAPVVTVDLPHEVGEPGDDSARLAIERWNSLEQAVGVALPRPFDHRTMAVSSAKAIAPAPTALPRRSPDCIERVDETVSVIEREGHERPIGANRIDEATSVPAVPENPNSKREWHGHEPAPAAGGEQPGSRRCCRKEADNAAEDHRCNLVEDRGHDPAHQRRENEREPPRGAEDHDEHHAHHDEHRHRLKPR